MKKTVIFAIVIVGLIGIGCGGSNNTLAPFQPQVNNATDTFQLQATGVQNVSSILEYDWQNSGTSANVNQSTVVTAGTATLVLFDAAPTQVYSSDLATNGTLATSTGTAGLWKVRVTLSGFSGTLNFRVQKP